MAQCVELVGDQDSRFLALQAMLALAVATGSYDARSRAFLKRVADQFGVSWRAVAAVELAIAVQLVAGVESPTDEPRDEGEEERVESGERGEKPRSVDQLLIERRKKKMRVKKAIKISGITLMGGMLFGLTGGLIAPALLSALAGVGVASAAGLAASGSLASTAVVGSLFGVAGVGFTVRKARNRISTNLEEFDFERPDDPRVVQEKQLRADRERRKMEKLVAARLAEEAATKSHLAIESSPSMSEVSPPGTSRFDPEKELPRPTVVSDEDEDASENEAKKNGRFGQWKKKREKLKVGSRGLEAASHIPSLHVCICVPAWLTDRYFGAALDQFEAALKLELPCSQHIALRWESRRLYEMGLAFAKFWASKATVTTVQQAYPHAVAAASTVAGAVAFAFAIPLTVMSCMDYIDNPWSILVSRSNGAGDELADVLVERSYGNRPVSLFGYSIGARVIFKCLESLASRGALGIVDSVFLVGAAVTADPERWKKIRPVVAGRIVNAYGSYDWALAFFHRGCGNGVYVSGLRRVELDGVENLNMAYLGFEGHREMKDCVPRVIRAMGLGVGYIVMPPAKLVHHRFNSKNRDRKSDTPVCEEPVRQGKSSEMNFSSPGSNEDDDGRHLSGLRDEGVYDWNAPNSKMQLDDDISLPSTSDTGDVSNLSLASGDERGGAVPDKKGTSTKKKKSKSWLSWSPWQGSGSALTEKRNAAKHSGEKAQGAVDVQDCVQGSTAEVVEQMDKRGVLQSNGQQIVGDAGVVVMNDLLDNEAEGEENVIGRLGDGERQGAVLSLENADERFRVDEAREVVVGADGLDSVDGNGENEDAEPFDWEKQRRIWEEQEKQMLERGFADSAIEIEMRHKMILGISLEIAGRRLFPFIEQDADLPVAKVEETFTNCVDEQGGMVIRIYEHERRTKSVALNMIRCDEQYPKLLGEIELRLREAGVKGLLRVSVCMWADENGDIFVAAEERLGEGKIGDRAELRIERDELCTMAERLRLEAAERKRIEAQLQKELRNRAASQVPALMAGEESGSAGDNGDDWRREEAN